MKAALTQLTWQHYRLNPDLPSEEKMGCLLVSHFTKSGCSTIYKRNRNFHYFSWHTCLYLATAQREPAETEEPFRGTAQRGACCCHPCQPSLCHQLWPLGEPAALSSHLKGYLYPAQIGRGSAFLCSLPWAVSSMRAPGASGQSMGRLPCLAWGHHHGDTKQPCQRHGVPPILLQHCPGYPSCATRPLQESGDLWQCRDPTWYQHCSFSPSFRPMGMQPPPPSLLLVLTPAGRMTNTTQPEAFVKSLFC